MKIGITGSQGFIAWHLRCFYLLQPGVKILPADRDTFSNRKALEDFVREADVIVHLAGVNRSSDEEIYSGNVGLAKDLVSACAETGCSPHILFASSTHAEQLQTVYGKAKAHASQIFEGWAEENNALYTLLIIPHVFGEYGRPNYNSVIATFCHQLAQEKAPGITGNGVLELVHVQDLCEEIHNFILNKRNGKKRIKGYSISVEEVADKLLALADQYRSGIVPPLDDPFTLSLFNALRGAIPNEKRQIGAFQHKDERGWLVETVKVGSGGQCFVSSTKPQVVRGNHFHRRKFERFFVLKGKAHIKLRKLFSMQINDYFLDGSIPSFVDIPTLHTHNITNIGEGELITLFWSNEIFDPGKPDTYAEKV